MRRDFHIIAFPAGRRVVVGVAADGIAEAVVAHAAAHAKVRGEFVDVIEVGGRHIAVVGPDGPVVA